MLLISVLPLAFADSVALGPIGLFIDGDLNGAFVAGLFVNGLHLVGARRVEEEVPGGACQGDSVKTVE